MQVLHKVIENYLEEVCAQVKYKKAHSQITYELSNHIYELVDNYVDRGMTEEEATIKAVLQMGNATDIGKELHKTHRPKIEWSLLVLVGVTIIIGLISLFSLAKDPAFWSLNITMFIKSYSIYGTIGLVCFAIFYLVDYTKLEKYSLRIYVISLILLILSSRTHNTINGLSTFMIGSFRFSPVSYAIVTFTVSFSGLVIKWGKGDLKGMLKLFGIAVGATIVCLIQPSFAKAMLLASVFLVVITKAIMSKNFIGRRKVFLSVLYGGGMLSTILLYLVATDYQLARINFLKYKEDPLGSGYAYYMADKLKAGARLFGKGDGLYVNGSGVNNIVIGLPEANTDFILTYIVSAFGWIIGLSLIIILGLIIVRMFKATKSIHTPYGRYLSVSILTIFTMQSAINILMNFGFFPYIGLGLPLVSYGGSNFVTNMVLLGLFLGIYRRKDLVQNDKVPLQEYTEKEELKNV